MSKASIIQKTNPVSYFTTNRLGNKDSSSLLSDLLPLNSKINFTNLIKCKRRKENLLHCREWYNESRLTQSLWDQDKGITLTNKQPPTTDTKKLIDGYLGLGQSG